MKNIFLILVLFATVSYGQLVVNTELDVVSEGDGLTSLREAVIYANQTAGQQTVTLDGSVFLPGANRIVYLKSALELTDASGTIIDGSAGKITLDGSQIDSSADNFKNALVLKSGNNEIANIYLQNFLGAAILIDSLNAGNNTIGPNNWISEGDGSGISVKASENNIINDNYIWSNAGKGIEIYNSGNTTIINNYITLNMEGGIYLNMDSGNNTIEKNDLINNGYSGIFIYAGSGNSILSNTIGNTGDIRLPNSAGTEKKMPDIIARVFELQVPVLYSSEGIQLMGVTETEILSNTVNRCTNYGIRMDGIVVIDSSGGSLDTTFYVPEAIHIKSNFFEENGINDITLYNAHSAIIEENFMQYSGSGIYGRGLSKINPALVDRDSIDRGDFIIRDNIFSYIGHRDVRKISSIQRPADGAILLSDLQTAHIYNNKIMNSGGGMYLASITQAFVYSNNLNSLNYRGVDAYQIDSCVIHDNNLSNTVESGIYIYNYFDVNRGPDINYIDIYQNTISNIQGNAIGCDLVDHLAITKNTITNVEQVGISTSDCKESYIKNNTVSGCTAPSLLVQNTPLVNINLNQFINPSGLGMPSVQFAYLGKASISENLISDATENGIVSNYVDTLLLKENQIISCNGFGCNFGGSQLIQMIRNEIHGNINGAYFFESDSIILDANTISGNRMGGLDLNTNHYCLISNNYIMENKRNGIQVNVMDTCIVQNNYIADNGYGYMTSDPGGQILRQNTIQNNENFGAINYNLVDSLDARLNYWGHVNGPDTSSSVIPNTEIGDKINMMVQYIPFLTSPTMELQLKPEITSMDPTESAITGGETAVIIGRQFLPGIQVYFGDTMADSVRFYTSTILKCKIPSGEEGYTDVIVINENGLADTLLNGFYYSPVISLENSESGLPKRSVLYANYPNPFNPITVISYSVGANNYSPVQIDLSIYNSLGQKVCTLVSEQQGAGNYSVEWNASGFSSGIYFYRIKAGSYEMVRKMLLVK